MPGPQIGNTSDPDWTAFKLDRMRLIFQNRDAHALHSLCDALAVVPPVVIAQNADDAQRRLQSFQDISDWLWFDELTTYNALNYEIAGDDNQIGMLSVCLIDH